ncbi:MAG: HEAT repeat domain-containing protein, partial [Mesorhizobium sp.]
MTAFDPFEDFGDIEEIGERLNDADAAVRRLAV